MELGFETNFFLAPLSSILCADFYQKRMAAINFECYINLVVGNDPNWPAGHIYPTPTHQAITHTGLHWLGFSPLSFFYLCVFISVQILKSICTEILLFTSVTFVLGFAGAQLASWPMFFSTRCCDDLSNIVTNVSKSIRSSTNECFSNYCNVISLNCFHDSWKTSANLGAWFQPFFQKKSEKY